MAGFTDYQHTIVVVYDYSESDCNWFYVQLNFTLIIFLEKTDHFL